MHIGQKFGFLNWGGGGLYLVFLRKNEMQSYDVYKALYLNCEVQAP